MLRNEASPLVMLRFAVMLRNEASLLVMLRNEASLLVMLRNEASLHRVILIILVKNNIMRVNRKTYSVYIVTNKNKTVLYTGVTNNLEQRIIEHYLDRIDKKTFAGKYNCHYLVFYENYQSINNAIAREKEIKGWLRIKKDKIISEFNNEWKFLNEELLGEWPPTHTFHRKDK
jgi:putative endonuclease